MKSQNGESHPPPASRIFVKKTLPTNRPPRVVVISWLLLSQPFLFRFVWEMVDHSAYVVCVCGMTRWIAVADRSAPYLIFRGVANQATYHCAYLVKSTLSNVDILKKSSTEKTCLASFCSWILRSKTKELISDFFSGKPHKTLLRNLTLKEETLLARALGVGYLLHPPPPPRTLFWYTLMFWNTPPRSDIKRQFCPLHMFNVLHHGKKESVNNSFWKLYRILLPQLLGTDYPYPFLAYVEKVTRHRTTPPPFPHPGSEKKNTFLFVTLLGRILQTTTKAFLLLKHWRSVNHPPSITVWLSLIHLILCVLLL